MSYLASVLEPLPEECQVALEDIFDLPDGNG